MPATTNNGTVNETFAGAPAHYRKTYDRSRLLPSNRRLRHLHGLSLRNVSLSTCATVKLKSDVEKASMRRSRSASIRGSQSTRVAATKSSPSSLGEPAGQSLKGSSAKDANRGDATNMRSERPSLEGPTRRRTTFNWAGRSPHERQQKWEDVVGSRMVDSWFSLHCDGTEEPIYVSEVVSLAMNPDYRFFDLTSTGPLINRLASLTVRIWAKTKTMPEYELLLDLQLHLPSLAFIGKSLDQLQHSLPQNCVLLYIHDGIYTNVVVPALHEGPGPAAGTTTPRVGSEARTTSSYDALMQLSSLDDCIQDALITRENLTYQINQILGRAVPISKHDGQIRTGDATSTALIHWKAPLSPADPLASLRRCLIAERKHLQAKTRSHADLVKSLQGRREVLIRGRKTQDDGEEELKEVKMKLRDTEVDLRNCNNRLRGQRRRICEDLMAVYPVEPIPHQPMEFTVRSLSLRNSSMEAREEDSTKTAAAFGYVSHVVVLLSSYLSVPLPYPVQPRLSASLIRDEISIMADDQRIFPLYPQKSFEYRFDYGVFLLNKDIEFLMSRQGLKVLDLRHTLPNLRYLLYVLSADDDSSVLPARTVGGIKGLLPGPIRSPTLSRMQSFDSLNCRDHNRSSIGVAANTTTSGISISTSTTTTAAAAAAARKRSEATVVNKTGLDRLTVSGINSHAHATVTTSSLLTDSISSTTVPASAVSSLSQADHILLPPMTFSFRARSARKSPKASSLLPSQWS